MPPCATSGRWISTLSWPIKRNTGSGKQFLNGLGGLRNKSSVDAFNSKTTFPTFTPGFEPYDYTGGRWLLKDKAQRDTRRVNFNFDALMSAAVESCPGSRHVVACTKKEGGFNKVFMITLDNGQTIVARLPTRIAGPQAYSTASEVATLSFLNRHIEVLVPQVLKWSNDCSNPVGAEYIIMTKVTGVKLADLWPTMSGVQQIECIRSLSKIMRKLTTSSFPAYGSLYFKESLPATTARVVLGKGFDDLCIGPHSGSQYWGCDLDQSDGQRACYVNQGPWSDLPDYINGLISIGQSSIPKISDISATDRLEYQGSTEEILRLLNISQIVLDKITTSDAIRKASTPTLFHPDFHSRNIYVAEDDPTTITGIIDWQSASIEPAFVYAAETPDFAEELPFDRATDNTEMDSEDAKIARDNAFLCAQAWAVLTRVDPKIGPATQLDEDLVKLLTTSHTGWRNGAAAMRSQLMKISEKWSDLGFPGSCPYTPTTEEHEMQQLHGEDFETVQRLRMFLSRSLGCDTDGWVATDYWDDAVAKHEALFADWMQRARDTKNSESPLTLTKASRLWPFDSID